MCNKIRFLPAWVLLAFAGVANAETTLVLTNASLIDGNGGPVVSGATVEVSGKTISRVHTGSYEADGNEAVEVVDLDGAFLMPGLWNNHSHLADLLPDPKNTLEGESSIRATIRGGRNAMDALRAGFTSLRVVGESDYIDVAWRDAFDAGVFVGPQIYASGPPITAVGGHGTQIDGIAVEEVATVDDIRRAVLDHVANDVDRVKIMVDMLTPAQIEVAINTAHEAGIKIVGHAAEPGASIAVGLGIDGIEHGYGLTADTIQLMVENNTFYDPTVVCNLSAEYISEREQHVDLAGYPATDAARAGRVMVAYADERTPEFAARQRRILGDALAAGVQVISGSDSNPIDEIGILEIEQIVHSGATEMQALQAATRNSANMMGVLDKVGTIEAGKIADMIVLAKSPLQNISNLRSLTAVIRNGQPVELQVSEGRADFWSLYFLDETTGSEQ